MRSPLGTYLARPSSHDSLMSVAGSIHLRPYFAGMPAESICCQMLWCHSLASLEDAVRTIFGELELTGGASAKGYYIELVTNQYLRPMTRRILASVTSLAK